MSSRSPIVMASCLPQNPWTVECGLYTRVDGSVIYIASKHQLLFSANKSYSDDIEKASLECHKVKSETRNKAEMNAGSKEEDN